MGTVRIRIGHDDDFVIIGIFHIEISPYSCTDGVDHGVDFFIFHDVCHLGLGGIENLSSQGQDSLEFPVTALLG